MTGPTPRVRTASWRLTLILLAVGFIALFLVIPLVAVFVQALSKGWAVYGGALVEPDAVSAIKLTLLVAAIAVPLNVLFGRRPVALGAVKPLTSEGKAITLDDIDDLDEDSGRRLIFRKRSNLAISLERGVPGILTQVHRAPRVARLVDADVVAPRDQLRHHAAQEVRVPMVPVRRE